MSSLRSGLNTRSTCRFNMASMGSPPRLHSIRTSIGVCHSGRSAFFFRQLGDRGRRVLQREQLPAVGQNGGILKRGRPGHRKKLFLKWGRGRPWGQAAPNRAVRRPKTVSHLRDCSHARRAKIGRNKTRLLSLMSALPVNSGTRISVQNSYSKATPSESFSSNAGFRGVRGGADLDVLGVTNLTGVDIDENCHPCGPLQSKGPHTGKYIDGANYEDGEPAQPEPHIQRVSVHCRSIMQCCRDP